jgi:hypothetical protein
MEYVLWFWKVESIAPRQHLATYFAVLVVESLLQAIKNHAIGPLNLAIGSWVRNQIGYDSVGEVELMQDIADEVDYPIRCELGNRLVFNPLCKLVDCYQHMSETSWRCYQWSNHIKAPASRWPRWWDGDKILSWDM